MTLKTKSCAWILMIIMLPGILLFSFGNGVQAHALSASFTQISFNTTETDMSFSLDMLSVMESMGGDSNHDGALDEQELGALHRRLEEWIDDSVVLEMNQRQQEGELQSIQLEKKGDKQVVTWTYRFPAYAAGQTISLNDGLYTQSTAPAGTSYVNLLTAKQGGQVNQAVLQGKDRTWILLLSEDQGGQQAQEQQPALAVPEKPQAAAGNQAEAAPTPASTMKSEGSSPVVKAAPASSNGAASGFFSFFKLGMHHILTGYDHLLFLLALLLRKQTFKQYAAIISAFTIAHSLTLTMAVLGWVTLPSRLVESTIALSICYVALENIFRREIKHRALLTFAFGLIHGLGFASILQEMELPKSHLAISLVSFNLGIEVIQLSIVLLLFPVLKFFHQARISGASIRYGSVTITLLGGFWLFERLFL
ncbi:hypothetical protein CF651_06685 [Paenibacillus rigui]|uniref:HupE / UreJ protein n=2 Tax=Paenibacillus rigui TaxID=554312 RepID=A0A229UVE0_9BACL|nr:hypothetical protein CF651_06685 [Paenibacillus rigui]